MTAIEWLIIQIKNDQNQKALSAKEWLEVIEQAKEMEKQQMSKIYEGILQNVGTSIKQSDLPTFEQYYNETYGSNGSDESIKQFSLYEHKETITSADTKVSETFLDHVPEVKKMLEISDEEIEKEANNLFAGDLMWSERIAFKVAIKWYREQLKKKQ